MTLIHGSLLLQAASSCGMDKLKWVYINLYKDLCISQFHRKKDTVRKESPSLKNQWDISSGKLWFKNIVVWKTAVLVPQISQKC